MSKTAKADASKGAFAVTADGKKLNAMIADVFRRFDKVTMDAHVVLASCVLQAVQHGNVDYATRFINGIHGRMDASSMVKWLGAYGPFKFNSKAKEGAAHGHFTLDKERLDEFKKELSKDEKAFMLKMDAEKFWEFAPPSKLKDFDLPELIASLVKRGDKVKSGEMEVKSSKLVGLEELRKLAQKLAV